MSSTSTTPLPTFTISPPPLLLPSAHTHDTPIEPALIAISTIITTLVLALLLLSFTNTPKHKHNNTRTTSQANNPNPDPTPRRLQISAPLILDQHDDATSHHVPSNATKPPFYAESKWLSGKLDQSVQKEVFGTTTRSASQQIPVYKATSQQQRIELGILQPATAVVRKPPAAYNLGRM